MKKFIVLTCLVLFFSSCSAVDKNPQKKFGKDSYYYLGLKAADQHNEREAVRLLKISSEKGSEAVSRRSAEALTMIGSVKDRVEASKILAERFSDEEAAIIACKELFRDGEFSSIIEITDGTDLKSGSNELIEFRMLSMIEKEDSRLPSEFYKWFVSRPVTAHHMKVYQGYKELEFRHMEQIQVHARKFQDDVNRFRLLEQSLSPDAEESAESEKETEAEGKESEFSDIFENFITEESEFESPRQTIIDYRVAIYRKKYLESFDLIGKILKTYDNLEEEIDCQLLSDIGKAALYGTKDYAASARFFERLAKNVSSDRAYYAFFYSARLYDKSGRNQSKADSRFKAALNCAQDEAQFDNCLWYLLNFQLRTSTDDIIETLKSYGSSINSPEYFDDFYESLSVLLLSNHKWQDFYKVWKETDSNFSEKISGKYAYISGRLIEEGLAEGEAELKTRQVVDAYTKVLSSGTSLYYKVCAMERLNLSEDEIVGSMLLSKEHTENLTLEETPAGRLLAGYGAFGFPQKIYSEYVANRKDITVTEAIRSAKFLNQCGMRDSDNTEKYNVQSLRIAARSYDMASGKIPRELLELTFPRFYKQQLEKACLENDIPFYLMYALVHSESYFDSQIISRAGACGLTQLMEATAKDEAKKLKIQDFNILDPEINLRFGAHYLAGLMSRTEEKNKLLALFAYNAGLSHVRNWVNSSRKDWEATGRIFRGPCGIPTDLFLETLPFSETREYGRKLISAAALYGWLYEEKTPADVVREILY